MKQYIIHAFDGIDSEAMNRRLAARPAHFENMAKVKAAGNYILGGAILDSNDKMIGSTVVLQFALATDLQAYLDSEPYIQQGVWVDWKVMSFKMATIPTIPN